jgi:hypothetical protein
MKQNIISLALGVLVLGTMCCLAISPPLPKSLAARLDLATHVVVGVVRELTVVTITNGTARRADPPPAQLGLETTTESEIEVKEVLWPPDFKADGLLKYRFGGGFFGVDDLRRDTVGKTNIFILTQCKDKDGICFGPSYAWNLCESVNSREEIIELLRKRAKRTSERPNQVPEDTARKLADPQH